MQKIRDHKLPLIILTFLCVLLFSVPAFAQNMDELTGPGVQKTEPVEEEVPAPESLGTFSTTAYCSCSKCSNGTNRTYAGTVPTANHTISADLNVFPLGTQLMINNVIYTVEDKGHGVNGNKLDIFFDSHSDALNYGVKKVEVFKVD